MKKPALLLALIAGVGLMPAGRVIAQTVTHIAAGEEHSLFTESDGSLWGMGDNSFGQLGIGSAPANTNHPTQILSSGAGVVAAGGYHSLFFMSHALWGMGTNGSGQLGDGTTANHYVPEQIFSVGTRGSFTGIAGGLSHSLFGTLLNLGTSGGFWVMGNNTDGQLGDGTTTKQITPEEIESASPGSAVTAVAGGWNHSLFIKPDGSLWAMGYNGFGQLGDGTSTERHTPVQIVSSGVTAIAAGDNHSLFIKSDGSLWAMGYNSNGQLGDGTTTNSHIPVQIVPSNVVAVAGGHFHSLFIKSDGSLWAMGYNGFGELGDGTTTDRHLPVLIVASNVVAVAAGGPHSLFIKSDGSLWAMGDNHLGQLGDGTYTNHLSPVRIVPPPTPATVSLSNLNQTYDGTAKAVSVTTAPPGLSLNLTYSSSVNAPTNAGSYTVVATINDPNYQGGATNTLVIMPAPASVTLGNLLQSYDGTAKSVSITTVPPFLGCFVFYNGSGNAPTNASTYTVIGTITDPNYQGGATNTLTIITGLTVDTSQTLRTVDARWFGLNTAAWDGYLDTPETISALTELGTRILRWPGGSWGDIYHESAPPNNGWGSFTTNFIHVATSIHAQAFMIANYGTGTTNEAADWVRLCNITNNAQFKYWEVGNECYGSWEADNNNNAPYLAHDPWTYAMRFKDYYTQMKAVDPTIKIGIMVAPGEDSYELGAHYVFNPRTGVVHFGWTPVLLGTLQSLGVTPDFAVHHVYPEYQSDNDALLLQAASNWALDAADLRQQITDYMGPAGTNIELVCTENNADAGSQGRQSTSVVDALYLADSLSQIMKTEFNSFLWWDLRNGPDTGGDFDPSLYGWRTNGDLGIIRDLNTRYPTFYAMKLMQYFAQTGDTVLNPASSDSLLAVYAAQRTNGTVSVLVINKDPTSTLTRPIGFAGFAPNTLATIRSYGIPQDEATRTNSIVPGAQDIATNSFPNAGTTFNYAFPPYSLTLFTLAPAVPSLSVAPPAFQSGNAFVFQLQGPSGVKYVVQTSSNLIQWIPSLTNVLSGNVVNITNPIPPGAADNFWRVIWQL